MREGEELWRPSAEQIEGARITHYMRWLAQHGHRFEDYAALWRWSVSDVASFWRSISDYFEIIYHERGKEVLTGTKMPDVHWFPSSTLNYTEHALRRRDQHIAIIARDENGTEREVTYAELYRRVATMAAGLESLGVGKGDRVVALLPNGVEAVVAFLAVASRGAIWSSCAPEFGVKSILDRFTQIEPKVLFAATGYDFGGRHFDRVTELNEVRAGLPTLKATITLGGGALSTGTDTVLAWDAAQRPSDTVAFTPVPFEHPLWVLYSSGTTGLPKPIVQGQGGILLEHFKAIALHCDIKPEDRFFWYSTTGWMMWNFLIGGLLLGSTIVLYDGSPAYPNLNALWDFAAKIKMTYFGTSAPYLMACRKAELAPKVDRNLSALRAIGSTGAPLPVEGFEWVYESVKRDLLLGSVSGGTDVCTAFILSCPVLPVHAGEIQCSGLGANVAAFDPDGMPVVGEVGELVVTMPLPSMPIYFWNDTHGARYYESYFSTYPNIWRHGDWIKVTPTAGFVVYGRSDSTLNRGGVRMGTSEFYRVIEDLPEVSDSLVVDVSTPGGTEGKLWLFVVVRDGFILDDALRAKLRSTCRQLLSPRHVPDEIRAITVVPRTLNGKKMEVPIKRILMGQPVDKVVNKDTLSNPEALKPFLALV